MGIVWQMHHSIRCSQSCQLGQYKEKNARNRCGLSILVTVNPNTTSISSTIYDPTNMHVSHQQPWGLQQDVDLCSGRSKGENGY